MPKRSKHVLAPAGDLSPREAAFVREYLVDLNASQAAIRAGYSPKTAGQQAHAMLKRVGIASALSKAQAERGARVQLEADAVLRELAILVRSDVRDYIVGNDGSLTLREGAADEAWRAVASVKHKIIEIPQNDGDSMFRREIEFKLWDKNSAIEKAMKHLGMLKDAGGAVTVNETHNTQNVWVFGDRRLVF